MNRPNPALVAVLALLVLQACGAARPSQPGSPAPRPSAEVPFGAERARLDAAGAALTAGDYAAARSEATAAIELLLACAEEQRDADWLALLERAGKSALDAQDAPTAKRAFEAVHQVRVRDLPEDHQDLQRARLNLSASLNELGQIGDARQLQEAALAACTRTLPEDHPALQDAREALGVSLLQCGESARARDLFERAVAARERTMPEDHLDLQVARGFLASALDSLGDSRGARALDEQVLAVLSRTLPADHIYLQQARFNLAADLHALLDFEGARPLQEAVLAVYARTLPPDDLKLQTARVNLAATLSDLGDLDGARALEELALEVLSRTMPADHPDLQRARANFANLLHKLGDFDRARALEEAVLEVFSRTRPPDDVDLQGARGRLATTLHSLGEFEVSRSLQEQVVEVLSRTRPEDDGDLQAARRTLGATLYELGDLDGARVMLEQVLESYLQSLPEDHSSVLEVRGNLALLLMVIGDLDAATSVSQQVLEARSRTRPEDDRDLEWARTMLAEVLSRAAAVRAFGGGGGEEVEEGPWARCAPLMLAAVRTQTKSARKALSEGSPREAQARCVSLDKGLGSALSFAAGFGVFEPNPELDRAAFVLSETTRGAMLGSATLMRSAAGSPRYQDLREHLREQADEIALMVQSGTTSEDFRSALAQQEQAERELVDLARELSGGSLLGLDFDADALAARLDEDEVVVGFRRYVRGLIGMREAEGSNAPVPGLHQVHSLCAFVLRRGEASSGAEPSAATLTRVELGPIEPIEAAVHAWRAAIGTEVARGLSVPDTTEDLARARGLELRRLVFDPLLPALGQAKRLVLALDDVLHMVAIDALPLEETPGDADMQSRLVGDRWQIETRCTLAELAATAPARKEGGVLVALGGAKFNSEPLPPDAENLAAIEESVPQNAQFASILRGSAWKRGFPPLTHAGLEAREVAALHAEVFGDEAGGQAAEVVLEERRASRASLEALAPRARWLHIATHGWQASESIRSWQDPEPLDRSSGLAARQAALEQVKGMSPMLLCGLALAGANLPPDAAGRVPGLVTAQEMSTLDLSNCELVVLSACDTNVGERRAGQGVASLQMALQMAGARSVITSLWEVPDKATRELMVYFYKRVWVDKLSKQQALWEAKMRLRDAQDERGQPRYTLRDWAAWMLTGEPD